MTCAFHGCGHASYRNKLCHGHASQVLRGTPLRPLNQRMALATHCGRGHPLSGDNVRLYVVKGVIRQRCCKTCQRMHSARVSAQIKGIKTGDRRELTEKQLARMLDARRDDVSLDDLSDRFGRTREQVIADLEEARRLESQAQGVAT